MRQDYSPEEIKWQELLRSTLVTLANTINSLDINSIPKWEIRYLLWASVSINQAASGYLKLQEAQIQYASKLLIRPMLEAFLYAQAVINKRGFLFRKIYTEFDEFSKGDPNSTQAEFDETVKKYITAFKGYDGNYPCECKKVDMKYAAKVADMVDHYEVGYRIYCKYTHGAQIAVTGVLNEVTDDIDTPLVIELVLRTLGQLQKNTSEKISELASLKEQFNLLAQTLKGARSLGITK